MSRRQFVGRDDDGKAKFKQAEPGPWFPAKYPGKCVHCGESFEPGESIRVVDVYSHQCANCDPEVQTAVALLDIVRLSVHM